jgi:hypothetical protein
MKNTNIQMSGVGAMGLQAALAGSNSLAPTPAPVAPVASAVAPVAPATEVPVDPTAIAQPIPQIVNPLQEATNTNFSPNTQNAALNIYGDAASRGY